MKGGFANLMKQAQQIQENFQRAQEELANLEVTGESGAGMVKVTVTGRREVRKIVIDPTLLSEDKEMLEDLIAAAVNEAMRKVDKLSQNKLSDMTGGINLPPGLKLPF